MNPLRSTAATLLFASLSACTTQGEDNFANPPPGPPSSCQTIDALPGCGAGSASYSCAGDRPDDGDTSLVCDQGVTGLAGADGGAPGTTLYCCAPYGQWATECTPSVVPGCGAQSLGFACAGGTSPDQADSSLVCSQAMTGAAGSLFCCVPFSSSAGTCRCATFEADTATCGDPAAVTGCAGAAIGFSCASGRTPADVNPNLACTAPDGGAAGAYCCGTP